MKTNRVLVVLALFAGVTGSIATIEHNVRRSIEWTQGRLNWRSYATDRIAELRANVTIDDFESRLGRPRIITRLSSAGTTSTSFTQRIYQQRGYWVQAVVDNDDTVRNFAVTVCDPKLHPTWKNKNSSGESYKIQLGVTKMTAPAKFEELQFGIYDSIESAQFPLGTDSLTAALLSEDP